MPAVRQRIIIETDGKGLRVLDKDIDNHVRKSRKGFSAVSENIKGVGLAAKRYIGGVAIAAFTALGVALNNGVRRASEFQAGMAEVNTLLTDTSVSIEELSAGVKQIAKDTGKPLDDLTSALYQIISAGIPAGQALQFLDAASRSAIGGVTDTATAVDGLTNVINAFGLDASDAQTVADAMFVAVRNGKTTFGELSGSISAVAPIAANLGVSFEEILAGAAALTTGGTETSVAMTQLRSILVAVAKQTPNAAKAAKDLGLDFSLTALRAKGLQGFIQELSTATKGNEEALTDLLGRVEGLNGVLALGGAQADAFAKNLDDMQNRAGVATRAFDKMNETAKQTGARLRQRINVALTDLGEKVLPIVIKSMDSLIRLFDKFTTTSAERLLDRLDELGDAVDAEFKFSLRLSIQTDEAEKELKDLQKRINVQRLEAIPAVVTPAQNQFLQQVVRANTAGLRTILDNNESTIEDLRTVLKALRDEELRLIEEGAGSLRDVKDATTSVEIAEIKAHNRRIEQARQIREQLEEAQREVSELIALRQQEADTQQRLADFQQKRLGGYEAEQKALEEQARLRQEEADAVRNAEERAEATRQAQLNAVALEEKAAEAREALRELNEELQVANAESPGLQKTLKDIFDVQGKIREAKAIESNLFGEDKEQATEILNAYKERLRLLEEQRDRIMRMTTAGQEFIDTIQNNGFGFEMLFGGMFENPEQEISNYIRDINSAVEAAAAANEGDILNKMLGLDKAESQTKIAAARLASILKGIRDRFAKGIPRNLQTSVIQLIESIKKLGPEGKQALADAGLEDFGDRFEEQASTVTDNLDDIADGLRALLRGADVFDFMTAEARQAAEGIVDIIDNLNEARDGINALRAGASGISAILGAAVPALGVAGGLLQIGRALIPDTSSQERAMQELEEALRDNASRVSESIDRLIEATRVGADVPGSSVQDLRDAINQFSINLNRNPDTGDIRSLLTIEDDLLAELNAKIRDAAFRFGEGSDRYYEAVRRATDNYEAAIEAARNDARNVLNSLFDELDSIDLGDDFGQDVKDSFRELAEQLLESGTPINEIIDTILNGGEDLTAGLVDILAELESIGGFGDSVEGAIAQLRLLQQFGTITTPDEALNEFINTLTQRGADGEFVIPISDTIAEFLRGIDLGTDEGRDTTRDQIAEFGRILSEGTEDQRTALLGGLDPTAFGDLINTILAILGDQEIPGPDVDTSSLEGAITGAQSAVDLLTRLLGYDAPKALEAFLERLRGSEAVQGSFLEPLIEELSGLDITIDADQERIREIIASLVTAINAGEFTPEDEAAARGFIEQLNALLNSEVGEIGLPMVDAVRTAADAVSLLQRIMGVDAATAISEFIDRLNESSDLTSSSIGQFIKELDALDPSTEAGRERIKEIIESITQAILAGQLADDEDAAARNLVEFLAPLLGSESEDGFTRRTGIDRIITDTQANEVIVWLASILDQVRGFRQDVNDYFYRSLGSGQYSNIIRDNSPSAISSSVTSTNVFNIDIETANDEDAIIEELSRQVRDRLRKHFRGS